ncbi:MAG: hypothetical protein AAFV38_04900, partial [Pseudomonadota bacterium]
KIGTNDFNNVSNFFNRFDATMANLASAIDRYFAVADADAHMVVSSLAPNLLVGPEGVELAEFMLEGFSVVNGENVAGDAGNGTYSPGYRATVEAAQLTYANLHFFDNPVTENELTTDLVHYTEEGYALYAEELADFLETEIGFSGGTLDGTVNSLGQSTAIDGGQAGDFILGNGQANSINGNGGNDVIIGNGGEDILNGGAGIDRLEGGARADVVSGGADADAFIFNTNFATNVGANEVDAVLDFDFSEDWFVFDDSFLGQITVTDGTNGDVVLNVGTTGEINVSGTGLQSLKGADLGGGVFALVEGTDVIIFVEDTNLFLS